MKFPSCEFDDAVAALCHGTIHEEELADLHGLLCVDPDASDEYLWRVEVHGELASGKLNFGNLSECEEVDASAKIFPLSDRIATQVKPRRSLSMKVAAAILFVVFLGGGMLKWYGASVSPEKPEVVARFVELQECRWMVSTTPVHPMDAIGVGQRIELSSGLAQVEFDSGAHMTILGPTILEPLSNNSAFLMQGQVQLVAGTPDSKGFKLQTPNSTFVDIGTAFTARVTPDGLDHLNVTDGEVDVVLGDIKSPPRLRAGESLYIEPGKRRVMTRIEPGDGTAEFRFPNIAPPSNADYADQAFGQASIRVVQGQLKKYPGQNAPETLLLDGMIQRRPQDPRMSAFFDHHSGGSFLVDLGQAISVTKINTYSWHQHHQREENRRRATQQYTLYGYSGDQLPDMTLSLNLREWTRIARVNTDSFFDVDKPINPNRPAQQACSITAAHGEIGRFRYLLFVVKGGTFFGEFDIFGSP